MQSIYVANQSYNQSTDTTNSRSVIELTIKPVVWYSKWKANCKNQEFYVKSIERSLVGVFLCH